MLRAAVLGVPAALLLVLGWTHRWNSDDAFINFRVVDQLVHGNGPVFNVGERVEAYTSTLWIVVLAVPAALVGSNYLEWIAVLLGLGMSVAGLAAATWGAVLLNGDRPGVMLPLGALVFAVLPPSWDFATSGLETGLGFGWLGTCFLGLVLVQTSERWRVADWRGLQPLDGVTFLAGLAPLLRPDFALFGAGFLLLAVVISPRPPRRAAIRALAFALPVPVVYQVFRMGYFAALVPNTALAKEAGRSGWEHGLDYLWDTVGAYALYLPVIGLLGWLALRIRDDLRSGAHANALLHAVPPATGLLHLLFVVKVGGDFMHGRFVLPGLFAILTPVAAIPMRRRHLELVLGVSVVVWAVACAAALRASYHDHARPFSTRGFVDERRTYVLGAREAHPVTLGDYRRHPWEPQGEAMSLSASAAPHLVTFAGPDIGRSRPDLATRPDVRAALVVPGASVGIFGYAAGRKVWIVDQRGLGDPIAARIRIVRRGVPGHEKLLGTDWVVARFARSSPPDPRVADARRALRCGDLRRTLEAVTGKMTFDRFLDNLMLSPASTRLRVSADPRDARRNLCR